MTDVPIGAYVIGPLLDIVGFFGRDRAWGHDLYVSAGYTLLAGAAFSALTLATGLADWLRMRPGSEVRRITNSHALTMLAVSACVVTDLIVRYAGDSEVTTGPLVALGLAILVLVTAGGAIGGSLVFDKGYKVRAKMSGPAAPEQTGEK